MRLLLDTHVYLWYLADSRKLSAEARKRIEAADDVFVSAASIWESAIKAALGKLKVEPAELLEGIEASGFSSLAITPAHAAAVMTLPNHHRDPFDRLLIAQAMHEPMRLLTTDETLRLYTDLVDLI